MKALLEIVKCDHCGQLGVSIDDLRVTSHKCLGSWHTVFSEDCELEAKAAPRVATPEMVDALVRVITTTPGSWWTIAKAALRSLGFTVADSGGK